MSDAMEVDTRNAQLELFELAEQPARRTKSWVPRALMLRHDHAVLLLIFGLIGGSVVFAFGVERGKQLARAERMLLDPSPMKSASLSNATPSVPAAKSAVNQKTGKSETALKAPAPKAAPSTPAKLPGKTRYAVRVVTYHQPNLAQLELQRLQKRGESAFLVKQSDRVALYIGPFPSKEHATEKLITLRRQYRDCFVQRL